MTDDPEVRAAIAETDPTKPEPGERLWHVVYRSGAVVAVVALVLAALVGLSGLSTASCINRNLGQRSDSSTQQLNAEKNFAKDQTAALGEFLQGTTRADGLAAFNDLIQAGVRFGSSLDSVQRQRDAAPLGKC